MKKKLIRILVAAVLFIGFAIYYYVYENTDNSYSILIPLIIAIAIYLLISYDILRKAFLNLIHGNVFDENLLMIIASIGAFCLEEYVEAIAVILLFQVGEYFEKIALGKSRKSIASLIDNSPKKARVKVNDNFIDMNVNDVKIGDIIKVVPGDIVPLDSIIVEGSSFFDTKTLTGESVPKEINKNTELFAGYINMSSPIIAKVVKISNDSAISKMYKMILTATGNKTKSETYIAKFAKVYTPIVVFLALLIAIVPTLIFKDYSTYIQRALNFLVLSCPCAIVISVPLTFFGGIGNASKNGILVKGSNYLEKLSHVDNVFMDKTGTITNGNLSVVKVVGDVLENAAICEENSTHPIAKAIMNYVNSNKIKYNSNGFSINEKFGLGIEAVSKDKRVLCGNYSFMKENKIKCEEVDAVESIIYIANNGVYLGYILITDEIKKNAKNTIDYLNKNGISAVMLTGDNNKTSKYIADKIGISNYKSNLLPKDKSEEILNAKEQNKTVAFIGDGVNDSLSIANSDVGIAMAKTASDITIEASDITIMNDDLYSVAKSIEISKKTMRIVKENIIFSIGIKVIILILSIFGFANIWLAIFGDSGVLILATINAMRMLLNKKIHNL